MPYHIGVGGAWKLCDKAYIGVGGAWKQIQKMHIGVGGVWKEFYTYLSVACADLAANRTTTVPTNATATLSILNDGTWSTTTIGGGTSTGTWLTGGSASAVEVTFTGTGTTPTGDAVGTPLNCGTTRTWSLTETSDVGATRSFSGTLTFKDASTLDTLDTSTASITATTDPG